MHELDCQHFAYYQQNYINCFAAEIYRDCCFFIKLCVIYSFTTVAQSGHIAVMRKKFYYESNLSYYEEKQCIWTHSTLLSAHLSIMKANVCIMKGIISLQKSLTLL